MTDAELVEKIRLFLEPLPAKIDHALWTDSSQQMRSDLSYMKGLFEAILDEVSRHREARMLDDDSYAAPV